MYSKGMTTTNMIIVMMLIFNLFCRDSYKRSIHWYLTVNPSKDIHVRSSRNSLSSSSAASSQTIAEANNIPARFNFTLSPGSTNGKQVAYIRLLQALGKLGPKAVITDRTRNSAQMVSFCYSHLIPLMIISKFQ